MSTRASLTALTLGLLPSLLIAQDSSERLWHHRNLGKAFYENPVTQYEAVEELKKALDLAPDSARERLNYGLALLAAGKTAEGIVELRKAQQQDPSLPHSWFNLGIAYKRDSQYELAVEQLEGMIARVADDPIAHYNLGVLYRLTGRGEDSLRHIERAAALDPNLAGPQFQLATAYRKAKRSDDAKQAMARFRELKKRQADAPFPEDLEWSWYSELYAEVEAAPPPAKGNLKLTSQALAEGFDSATAGLLTFDATGDGKPELLAFSRQGARLFAGGKAVQNSGIDGLAGIRGAAHGDIDNDGLADLCILSKNAAWLLINRGGRFERRTEPLASGVFHQAVWLDYDHDYDLDLFLLGKTQRLLRNGGSAGWTDHSADFPFVDGEALAGVRFDWLSDTQNVDLAVSYKNRSGVVYRDLLAGRYQTQPLNALPPGTTQLGAWDLDNDGWTDLVAANTQDTTLLINDRSLGFRAVAGPSGAHAPLTFVDLENRTVFELLSSAGVHRNVGSSRFARAEQINDLASSSAMVAADFDTDGRWDLAAIGDDGKLRLLTNASSSGNRWLRVSLEGVKNLKLAPGAEIEVKAGRIYQKQHYRGEPLLFGLGSYAEADTVRITWPNGMIQNETRQPAGELPPFKEAQRLSGSCPMIFTWNGEEFEFITDVLGVAPLGASAGNGEYFPVDHDEIIQISSDSLVEKNGFYEIRITEELREVAFLDEIRLIAVDHPATVDIFTNEKFKGPPFPEFRLFGVTERFYPRSARDHQGSDVLDRLEARDRIYPDDFARDFTGVAELHHLDLDFGPEAAEGELLVLSGWVDWADGSTFLGASQEADGGLIMPYLQAKNSAGQWLTILEDMGIPAGKPKTIALDLSGRWPSAHRELRIVTNLCVYWDEIFLGRSAAEPPTRLTDLHTVSAELRFGGFARAVIHAERKQPEHFVYAVKRSLSMWNPTRGLYTRYGNVRPLLGTTDDRLVVMGSGDELRLQFAATDLPQLPLGWRRDFLLFVDGWAKDGDANTAYSQTVGPLPYHAMPQYPYAAPDAFPDTPAHRRWREHYQVRPALRLIRPLVEEGP